MFNNGIEASLLTDASGNPLAVALDTSVQAVKTAVQAVTAAIQAQTDLTALFVTDTSTGKYYIRREVVNEGTGAITVTFLNLDGSTPGTAPSAANLVPALGASSTPLQLVTQNFDVVTAGSGYAVGDVLARVLFVNPSSAAITASAWFNLTQGAAVTSPTIANLVEQDANTKVTGTVAATEADGANAALGAKADAAYTGAGSASLVALMKGVYAATIAPLVAGANLIGKVGIDQTTPGTTNKVSIGSDGTVAATEADGANVTLGAKADAAYAGSGSGTMIAVLKGLYGLLFTANSRNTYLQAKSTNLAASATLGDANILNAGVSPSIFNFVSATFYSSQSGTVKIDAADSTGTYLPLASQAYTANTVAQIKLPIGGMSQFRAYLVNGSTASALAIVASSLTAA